MTRGEILVLNERAKAVSQAFFNLAIALIAAIAARLYALGGVDITAIFWSLGVVVLAFVAWKILYLLEPEY